MGELLNPERQDTYLLRSLLYRKAGDYTAALADCSTAIALDPSYAAAYYDRAEEPRAWKFWRRVRRPLETKVALDWAALPPAQRIELMTTHNLAKREKQKLELLRSLLTYFHYATKETRSDVFRSEIERINRAVQETKDRWRARELHVFVGEPKARTVNNLKKMVHDFSRIVEEHRS